MTTALDSAAARVLTAEAALDVAEADLAAVRRVAPSLVAAAEAAVRAAETDLDAASLAAATIASAWLAQREEP